MSRRSIVILRRTLYGLAVLAVAGFVLLVLPFLLVRNSEVREWMLLRGLPDAVRSAGLTMRIGQVIRFDPWAIEMRDITLSRSGPRGERTAASMSRLSLNWDPRDLLRRRLWMDAIEIDTLRVWLDAIAPPSKPEGEGAEEHASRRSGPPKLPWMRARSIVVRHGELWEAETLLVSGGADLENLEHRSGEVTARIRSIAGTYEPETLAVTLRDGRIRGDLERSLRLEESEISADGLRATIDGSMASPWAGEGLEGSARAQVSRLLPSKTRIGRMLRLPLAPGDSLAGTLEADYEGGILQGRAFLYGRLLDGPLGQLSIGGRLHADTLTVHSLELRHSAGGLAGEGEILLRAEAARMTLRFDDVDLGDPALQGWLRSFPQTRISGRFRGEARRAGDRISGRGAGTIDRVEIAGRGGAPLSFAGRYDGDLLTLDSLSLAGEGGSLRASGAWRRSTGEIDARARLDGISLEQWVEPWLPVPLAGAVTGRAALGGTIEHPMLSAGLVARDFRVVEARASELRVDSLAGEIAPLRLRGKVVGRGIDAYAVRADSADFEVTMAKRIDVAARAVRGNLAAHAQVSILPQEPGELQVTTLVIEPPDVAPWTLMRPARVSWAQGAAVIDSVLIESTDGKLEGRLAVGRGGSSLAGVARFEEFDLLVPRVLFGLPDSALGGFLDGEAEFGGSAERPSGLLRLSGREVFAAGWPVGEIDADLLLAESGEVRMDALDAGRGSGAGRIRLRDARIALPVPLPAFLRSARDSLADLLAETRFSCRLTVDDLSVARLVRTALEVSPSRTRILAEPTDPVASRIRTIVEGEHEAQAGREPMGGSLSLDAVLGGTAAAPQGVVKGRIDELRFYDARADSLIFAVSYEPEKLSLDNLVWHRGENASHAHGTIPLVASLVPGRSKVPPDRPLAFDIELPEIDLGILGIFSREITEPRGFLSGSLSLRGTPAKLRPAGSLAVRDAGIRIPYREERISDVNGLLILDSTGVRIESLKGKIGEEGRLKMTGTFAGLEDFDLEGEVRNATVFETGLYQFKADGDFRAFPVNTDEGIAPQVVGTVNIEEGTIIGDLAKKPPPVTGAKRKPSPWRAEVDVFAPGNIRMQTAVASIDLGQAENLHVSYVREELNISGGLSVLGGRYRVFNNVFEITSGTVEFRDTGRGVVAILDVYAESTVTDYSVPSEPTDVTIQIHAVGPVDDLRLDFTSTPDRATDEIVALLSIGRLRDPQTGSLDVGAPGQAYAVTEAVSQIEAQIGQRFRALQNLSVRPGEEPGGDWELNVRQTILPQVSVAYTRELSTSADQEVSVHYNLRGQLYLNAGVQRRQLQVGPPVDRYLLDLKLRFEYK